MNKIAIFMADGCEEIEGLTVVDILRRAQIEITMVSITKDLFVTGSHRVKFETDACIDDVDFDSYDGIVLPGGLPGTTNLGAHAKVVRLLKEFNQKEKLVSAICAAPSVLGQNELLEGKKATSYPGFEEKMTGCTYLEEKVVVDGNIITSRGMGTAIDFALAIVAYFKGEEAAATLSETIIYNYYLK